MGHSSAMHAFRIAAAAAMLGIVAPHAGQAEGPQGNNGPVYQRRAFEWKQDGNHNDFRGRDRRHFRQPVVPNVQSRWFTRPYPYHLDFYKMKYGGSYAPYFGNLYGPPQVVTAPPYYGPYYDNWGFGGPDGYGQFNGDGAGPMGFSAEPNGMIYGGPAAAAQSGGQPSAAPSGEGRPAWPGGSPGTARCWGA